MFINESVLKDLRLKKSPTKQKQNNSATLKVSRHSPQEMNYNDTIIDSQDEKLPMSEIQFEKVLKLNLSELLHKWKDNSTQIETQLIPYKDVIETKNQQQAYNECIHLIDTEFDNNEAQHKDAMHIINKKIFQVEDYKLRLKKQLQFLQEETKLMKEGLEQKQKIIDKQKEKRKEKTAARNLIEKGLMQKQQLQKQIQQCREKSHQQKTQYIEVQQNQFRLIQQLAKMEQEERQYDQKVERERRYNKLMQIREKIKNTKEKIEDEVLPHLQRKIHKMARLRSDLKEIQQALQISSVKIQDQNFIISALKEKIHTVHYDAIEQDNYTMFKKKYDEIYLSKNSEDNWKDYKQYLKHLTQRNKRRNSRAYTQGSNWGTPLSLENEMQMKSYNSRVQTKQKFSNRSRNLNAKKSVNSISEGDSKVTKLPKLVNNSQQSSSKFKKNLKSQKNTKKSIKQTPRNQESESANDSAQSEPSQVSGQIIQVDFHKKGKN